MARLKVLPAGLANMIAAGEVVQRPSSVVKELMENAIDAGADKVNVIVTDAGRTLIQVIDNGCGMSPSDAVLCFERHATSKISSQHDLEAIITYGFRGEALPSIAAVSEVVLKTRREQDETAVQVSVGGGKIKSAACQAPKGSNFAVRNLFYNTPARRKFLKSDNVELRHIIEEFTRVALTRPEISFSLSHNGRDIYVLKQAKSLKFRILDIIGGGVASNLVDLDSQTAMLNLSGFVGRPELSRKTASNQFFFVNGRYFRSAYLHKAVMQAYENLIPDGYSPSYFIFIDIDPGSIDVNISPTKSEIKFEDESVVYQIVYACVKEAVGKGGFGAGLDFDSTAEVQMPQLGRNFGEYRGMSAPVRPIDSSYDPFGTPSGPEDAQAALPQEPNYAFSSHTDQRQNYGRLFEDNALPQYDTLVLHGRYILSPTPSGLMVVSIARAFERIMYDRAVEAMSGASRGSQQALFPVQIRVGAATVPLFIENATVLSDIGFGISVIDSDTIEVFAVPEGYSCGSDKVTELVDSLIDIFGEPEAGVREIINQRLAERLSALGARHCQNVTNAQQARNLMDALLRCSNPELTASGKRVMSVVPSGEIDRLFQ